MSRHGRVLVARRNPRRRLVRRHEAGGVGGQWQKGLPTPRPRRIATSQVRRHVGRTARPKRRCSGSESAPASRLSVAGCRGWLWAAAIGGRRGSVGCSCTGGLVPSAVAVATALPWRVGSCCTLLLFTLPLLLTLLPLAFLPFTLFALVLLTQLSFALLLLLLALLSFTLLPLT